MKQNIWTKLFCLVLVLSLLLLPGCGGGNDTPGGDGPGVGGSQGDDFKGTTTTTKLEDGGKKVEKTDTDGKLVQEEYYGKDGKLDHYVTYEYDSNGKLLKEQRKGPKDDFWDGCEYVYDAEGKLTSKKIIDYRGVVAEEEFYLPDGTLVQRLTYRYDDNGNVINIRYYDGNREFLGCADQVFDDSGRMIQRVEMDYLEMPKRTYDYYEDGTMDETVGFRIDNGFLGEYRKLVTRIDANGKRLYATGYKGDGEKVTYTEYNADGSGTTWTYYTGYEGLQPETVQYETLFDKDNQFVKETYYHPETGKVISIKEGVFDENGKLTGKIERSWWPNGNLGSYTEYSPDDLGLLYQVYLEDGTLDYYSKCQYDENGRIIREDKYSGDDTYLGYQTYEYYENGNVKKFREYYADVGDIYGSDYDEEGNATSYYEHVGTED